MTDETDQESERGPLGRDRAHGVLNSVLAELPGVVYRCRKDRDWTLLGITANVEDLTGYTPSELIQGDPVPFADLVHPDDRERVWSDVQEAVEQNVPFRVIYRIRTRDGEMRWVLEQGRATRDEGETILAGYVQDLTGPLGKRLAESQDDLNRSRRQAERLSLLQSVSSIVSEERRLKSALRAAVPVICAALEFPVGHVFMAERGGAGELRSADVWHLDEGAEGLTAFREATEGGGWDPREGLPGRVMESGRAEWVADVKDNPRFLRVDETDPSPIRSGIGVPVMSEDRTLAVLEFYTTERRTADPESERLLEQIGVQLGRVWEREQAARALRTSERRFRQLAENVDAMFWLSTPEGEPLYLSSGWETLTGREEMVEGWRAYLEMIHPEDRERVEAVFSDPDRAPYELEYRIVRPDGDVRWVRQKAFPVHDEDGSVYRVGGLADDITEARRSRERLERILDSLAEGLLILHRDGHVTYANEAATELTPFGHPELVDRRYDSPEWGLTDLDGRTMDPEELPAVRALRTGEPVWNELIMMHGFDDGESRILSVNAVPYAPHGGEVSEVIVSFADVTARERYALELEESEKRFRQIAERIDSVFWISSPGKSEMEYVSPAYAEVWGRAPAELYAEPTSWLEQIHPDDRERVRSALPRQIEGAYEEEYRVVRPDGDVRWVWDRAFPIRDEEGEVHRLIGIAEDITGRKRAEEELRRAEAHYRALIENSADVIAVLDRELATRYVSPSIADVLGYTPEEIVDTSGFVRLHPEDREEAMEALRALRGRPGETVLHSARLLARDGTVRHVEARAQNLLDEPAVEGIVVNVRDVTERKELETQLRLSQRMEAVGRLAGGIAHDFNNLLTVIRSQSDLLLMDLSPESPLAEELDLIRETADRAADLTRQLLAFSREQVLRPKVVDLNRVLAGMEQLLVRVLGDDVAIETELSEDLPPIRVDSGQLEQVVMNLAVNARDAMPDGGTLRLVTGVEELEARDTASKPGIEPGSYVCFAVSDTGLGMDEETRARIFEPFYTTKEGREGTGLGLAVSYGIVKQSGGSIHVESEAGEGTTVTVRFPPAEGSPEPVDPVPVRGLGPGDLSARVLVVEDDPNVRRVARRILERASFEVRAVGDAESGVRLLEEEESDFDLVLTDLVLPGMGGRELVERIRKRRPDIRLVVMSGYAESSPGQRGDLPDEVAFIQKPFSPSGLVETVRERLTAE